MIEFMLYGPAIPWEKEDFTSKMEIKHMQSLVKEWLLMCHLLETRVPKVTIPKFNAVLAADKKLEKRKVADAVKGKETKEVVLLHPTGTPNPLGGGGGPGGGSGDGSGSGGPPGSGPPPPGGGPPGGGPPAGEPDPNPNPGPNPDPGDGDGGGPPDDDGDHSSDDAEDEALNRSYKDNIAIIVKHVVDKDGRNIKVRVPDTFNGSDPDKLRDFILGRRLYFQGNKQAFRSEANQVTFAISYLCGTVLDHFEPYILAFLTKSFSILYPENEAEEQLDLVIFPEDGKASTFFASFKKWKTRTNFSDRSY
ncbi:hypothetical protein M422DRAFT_250659 [Sphaerobolus stellatus SS14]|uniref:Uncharacterized protein n=1 Tax=Sphaerobolus stellatus (strain SS14) TaxID=990650 RepID=A0A0C9W3U8_SPHS4|nr:hypothetical protein M422DRAFT_250659 [Sphaerobolus stellatus SS14]